MQRHGHGTMPTPDGIWVLELSCEPSTEFQPTKYTLRLTVYGLSDSLGANLSLTTYWVGSNSLLSLIVTI